MAGLIPKDFITDLISRIDIVQYISNHVPLKQKGQNYFACCPFHDEKTASFSVSAPKQIYYCFGCGVGGNIVSFVMAYEHISFVDAIEQLAETLGISVPREGGHHQVPMVKPDDYQLMTEISQYYQQQLRHHSAAHTAIDYLKNRGLTGQIAQQFQIGFAPPGWHHLEQKFRSSRQALINTGMLIQKEETQQCYDRYRNRIMFPIHDYRGRIVGFGGRVIDENDQPKYLNSPETALFKKNRELYGMHQALQHNPSPSRIVVVEGYLDVVALAQYGIHYGIATLGTATSSSHIQLLARYTQQIIFCFDGDNAGQTAAWRALTHCLKLDLDGLDIRFLFLPDKEDPDSLVRSIGKTAMETLFSESLPLSDYFFTQLQQSADISSMHGRSQLLKEASRYFDTMPPSGTRQMLLERLAQLVRIDNHRLEAMLQQPSDDKPTHKKNPSQRRLSAQELAIVLLIQNPQLAQTASLYAYHNELKRLGYETIAEMLALAHDQPLTTANLLENWRKSDIFEKLSDYAHHPHHVPEAGIENELMGLFDQLTKKQSNQQIQALMQKANLGTLSEDEREHLQALIKASKGSSLN